MKDPTSMRLEVILLPVADTARAKAFYEKLGWRIDIDVAPNEHFRAIQVTPHHSQTSIIFGKGVTKMKPGSMDSLVLAVKNLDEARADLLERGIAVSEIFHFTAGPFNNSIKDARTPGRDPENKSYSSFASFEDPDGNRWLLQEITTRLPGREW